MSAVQDLLILHIFGIAKDYALDYPLDVLVRPDAEQDSLRSATALGSQIGATVDGRAEHVVDTVRVEDERRIGNVVLAGCLRQGQAFLQDAEDGFGHGFWTPGFQWATLPKAQVVDQVLAVPAFLPHRLQLVLVTFGCNGRQERKKNGSLGRVF